VESESGGILGGVARNFKVESESGGILGGVGGNFRWSRSRVEF
jgi:hypothetical protein